MVARSLNMMLADLESAFEARYRADTRLRRFIADASHELRTPLATIRGYAQMLARIPADDPAARERARSRIDAGAERMSALVDDLLVLPRLDAQDGASALEPVDVTVILLELEEDARAAAPDHWLALDVPTEPIVALAEALTVRRVLVNLLSNAWKHTPPGTAVTVRATAGATDGMPSCVVIDVVDDGLGVPEQIRAEVFERFVRADPGRSRGDASGSGSSGLGLAIVRSAVEAIGGTVALLPGWPTVFRMELPAAVSDPGTRSGPPPDDAEDGAGNGAPDDDSV